MPLSAAPVELATPVLIPAGDAAVTIEFGRSVHPATNARVRAVAEHLRAHRFDGVTDIVAAYAAVTLHFDPWRVMQTRNVDDPLAAVMALVEALIAKAPDVPRGKPRTHEIPVCYGGEHGEDLERVAEHCGLAPEAVIAQHSAPLYDVYFIGFAPGFPYLGGLPRKLATPRRDAPRARIAAGSVGIGAEQTGVYPVESPGGWNLIGRTPLALFDPVEAPSSLLRPGDHVRFVPIDAATFAQLKGDAR
ncbi:MAG: 5-oxoprolinase subunit PxpB [Burkholderiales bacterium]|nr:5-oxoprolinase subunit PxpB [Burkholderiales bacterium]